ncbi:sensor histidine kinase [Streptomyces sp. NPDC054796]
MPEPLSYAVQTGRGTSGPGYVPAAPGPQQGPSTTPGTHGTPGAHGSRGRHGKTPAPETAKDAAARRRMVRMAVLPAGIVAVTASAVVAYVMTAEGGLDATGAPTDDTHGTVLWSVLALALLLVCAAVAGGALLASSEARGTAERYAALRRSTVRSHAEVRALLQRLEQGERPRPRSQPPLPELPGDADALDLLAHELGRAQRAAEAAVTDAAALVRSSSNGSDEKVEVFVNLARRLQSLVHREIELLDELENEVEDPDLLKGLFHVDHLATRIRRHAENLAVLGGAVSRRQWSRPVTMTEVLRSSIAEVEQYPRVKLVPPIEGTLRGHAVADIIHLLAELVENATVYSAPQTQVLLRAQHVTAGLAVEVEDRGLGMTAAEQNRMNAVLSDPEPIDVAELLQDGRIGLFVVSALARRHGIVVQLQSNIYGGVQAVLVLPRVLLGDNTESVGKHDGSPEDGASPTAATATARAARARAEYAGEPERGTGRAIPGQAARPSLPEAAPGAGPGPGPRPPERQGLPERAAPSGRNGSSGHHGNGNGERPPARTAVGAPYEPPVPPVPEPQYAPEVPEPYASAAPHPPHAPHVEPSPPPVPGEPHHAPNGHGEAATAPAPAPYPAPHGLGDAEGPRPRLPRRRRQEHLVPELRDPPKARGRTDGDADQGHDPGLMAAFRRGTSLAEASEGAEAPGAPPPAAGGSLPLPAPGGDSPRTAR